MTATTTVKSLPNAITTLDIIKTFAVICMIIDHVGYYFFPDWNWFRAIGRLGGVPIWFFLIGYAKSRDIPSNWLIGVLILTVTEFLLFGNMFPLNVIFTIIAMRLTIDYVMNFVMRTRYIFWLSILLMTLFYIPTNWVTEYGTLAILCAIAGYITRNRDELVKYSFLNKYDYVGLYIFMPIAITVLQTSIFSFNAAQSLFLLVATSFMAFILVTMKPMTFPQIKGKVTNRILQYTGRHTLEIYVAHLIVFKIVFFTLYLMGFYQ